MLYASFVVSTNEHLDTTFKLRLRVPACLLLRTAQPTAGTHTLSHRTDKQIIAQGLRDTDAATLYSFSIFYLR